MFAAPEEGFDAFNPANVAPLVGYLASPEAGHISGEVMVVWGNQVDVLERPKFGPKFTSPDGGTWTVDALHQSLASHYDDNYTPVWGGFSVPPQ
jgi:3-oxoacyl-[acyl-carrier protein] reductase